MFRKYAAVALDDESTHKIAGTYFDSIAEDTIFENFGNYPDGINKDAVAHNIRVAARIQVDSA